MIVVADTSPLNYLVRLGFVDLLTGLYGRVLVPCAVITELLHDDAPEEVRAWALSPPSWLEQLRVKQIDPRISIELGPGEVEAISLALETCADVLLIDDYAGREQAKVCGIAVNGTLAVLFEASLRGQLDFEIEVQRLTRFGFRASPRLVETLIQRYREAIKQ